MLTTYPERARGQRIGWPSWCTGSNAFSCGAERRWGCRWTVDNNTLTHRSTRKTSRGQQPAPKQRSPRAGESGFGQRTLKRALSSRSLEGEILSLRSYLLCSPALKNQVDCFLPEALPAHWPHGDARVLDCGFTHTVGGQERKILKAKLKVL